MANWSYDDPTNGRWNGEVQSYTQNNAYIKDGALVIEARKEDITEPSGETYHYTSSKLITKGKKSWKYGKFEIRAKMPQGQGIWPAIWMMPEDEPFYGTWPKCGEIDIMELLATSLIKFMERSILESLIKNPRNVYLAGRPDFC